MTACPICATPLPRASITSRDRGHATPGRFEVAVCEKCDAGVTLPLAAADDLAAFYPTQYGPHSQLDRPLLALISRGIRHLQGLRSWRRPPLAALRNREPARGLDVGAGRGDTTAMLEARGWRMTAIEPSSAAAAGMRERGIEAREGGLATVELEMGAYDFVLFEHSLEHTIDPLADLRRAHAALRPGGQVLISVPNFGSWQRRLFRGAWYHLDLPRHRIHFAASTLERALRAVGFEKVDLARSSSAVGLAASLQYAAAGHCLFPSGLPLRVAAGLCELTVPLTAAFDRLLGEKDTLHAVATRTLAQPHERS